jgi:hypothetical protein
MLMLCMIDLVSSSVPSCSDVGHVEHSSEFSNASKTIQGFHLLAGTIVLSRVPESQEARVEIDEF